MYFINQKQYICYFNNFIFNLVYITILFMEKCLLQLLILLQFKVFSIQYFYYINKKQISRL